jgi:NADH:ubiquinone oxidoreductase subunit 4 (subunit M)
MDLLQEYLLVFIVFFPLVAALLVFLLPEDERGVMRWVSLLLSLVTLVLILVAWLGYDRVDAGIQYEAIHGPVPDP